MNYTSEIMVKYQRNIVTKPIGDTADYVYYEDTITMHSDCGDTTDTIRVGYTSVANIESVANTIKPISDDIIIDGCIYHIWGIRKHNTYDNYDSMVTHSYAFLEYSHTNEDLIPILVYTKKDHYTRFFYKNLNGEDIIIGRLFDHTTCKCIDNTHYNLKELANHLNTLMDNGFNIVPRNTRLKVTDRVYVSPIPDWATEYVDGTTQIVFSYTPTQEEYKVIKSIVDEHGDGLIDRYILDDVLGIDKFMI